MHGKSFLNAYQRKRLSQIAKDPKEESQIVTLASALLAADAHLRSARRKKTMAEIAVSHGMSRAGLYREIKSFQALRGVLPRIVYKDKRCGPLQVRKRTLSDYLSRSLPASLPAWMTIWAPPRWCYLTLEEIVEHLEKELGRTYSPRHVYRVIRSLGLRFVSLKMAQAAVEPWGPGETRKSIKQWIRVRWHDEYDFEKIRKRGERIQAGRRDGWQARKRNG